MITLANYLYKINSIQMPIRIKTSKPNFVPRNDWFARVQSQSTHRIKFKLPFPMDKKLLFLDMDETIIARSSHWFYRGKREFKINNEYIDIRPHLVDFISAVSTKYHIILFTASYKDRMSQILPLLPITFNTTLDRSFTTKGKSNFIHKYKLPVFKDLNRFNIKLKSTILLDDNPNYFLHSQLNGLKIKPYFGKNDDELLKYRDILLDIANSDNVQYTIGHLKMDYKDKFDGTRWIF